MDIFEKIGDTIVHVGKDVSKKAKDVSSIAKLKLDIKSREDFIKEQYIQLGKAYYEKHKDEPGEKKAQFARIEDALDAIAKMELQILELTGSKKCPDCGAKAAEDAEYCSVCGAKLSVVVDESPFEEDDMTESE